MDKCETQNLIISDVTGCSLWREGGKIALISNGISESRYRQRKDGKSKAVPHCDFANAGGVACNGGCMCSVLPRTYSCSKRYSQLAKLTYTTCYMLGGQISRNLIK